MTRWNWIPIALISAGAAVTVAATLLSSATTGTTIAILVGMLASVSAIPFLRREQNAEALELHAAQATLHAERTALQTEKEGVEEWRAQISTQLDEQVSRIEARERALAEKFAAHQELFEFPSSSELTGITPSNPVQLAEQDRQVLELLQQEAEAAFEKLRNNGYSRDGNPDVAAIREDVVSLVTRVAQVYAPDSERPLLETSFEKVARAAGRVCLHMLVLVEQLPLDVKQYSFSSLYSYMKKAVVAYGHYKTASPWLSYLTRGVHAGRLVAGTNPLSLGAWVVATEIGKRAGSKAIEKYVNQQAIGLLHDFIRVIGVEVANVYGGDFRHRDPNWIYGTELTALMGQFPISRESLREGLRQISGLPLRNEYDRIYLYRCLADHRSAPLHLTDPAMLTREEREQIATQLETFFRDFIHGASDDAVDQWRESFEGRFDMKLSLSTATDNAPGVDSKTRDCVDSVAGFLKWVVGLNDADVQGAMLNCDLCQTPDSASEPFTPERMPETFQPPGLDPTDPMVDRFLRSLVETVAAVIQPDENIEQLLAETGAYFRRTTTEITAQIDAVFVQRATADFDQSVWHAEVPPRLARLILQQDSRARFAYPDIVTTIDGKATSIPDGWLVGFSKSPRLKIFQLDKSDSSLWWADNATTERARGFLIDDCIVSGGQWNHDSFADTNSLTVAGALRGRGFANYFGPLLRLTTTLSDNLS